VPNDPEGFVEQALARGTTPCDSRWFGSLRVTCYAVKPGATFTGSEIVTTSQNFANLLALTGYSLGQTRVPSGGDVEIRLRWQVKGPLEDFGIWVGMQSADGSFWGREDRQPRNSRLLLSSSWQVGEVVTTRHRLPVLLGTPPGTYQVVAGVYRLADRRGLDVLDGLGRAQGQSLTIERVEVTRTVPAATGDASLPGRAIGPLATGVELAGYQVDGERAGPGGRARVTLLWRATGRPDSDLDLVVRLAPSGGAPVVVLRDALGGTLRSGSWQPGEFIREQRDVRIPADAPPGPAGLEVGLAAAGAEPASYTSLGGISLGTVARRYGEPRIDRRLDLDFSESGKPVIRLLGSNDLPASVRRGEKLRVALFWRALVDVASRYRVFVHVADASGEVKAQRDGEPVGWTRPTDTWLEGEVVEDVYDVEIGANVPAGEYVVRVGLYEPQSGVRLPAGGLDHVDVGQLVVQP